MDNRIKNGMKSKACFTTDLHGFTLMEITKEQVVSYYPCSSVFIRGKYEFFSVPIFRG